MEFYRNTNKKLTIVELQLLITISDLPRFCSSIYEVMHDDGDHGEINCLWGVFIVHREVIKDGLRFTLPGCPNAVAWTITVESSNDEIVVHLTINQKQHDPDFIESIEQFVNDWRTGLERPA